MAIKLTKLDIQVILDEKPYNLDTAIYYANQLSERYDKLYCVVRNKKSRRVKKYDIISLNEFRDTIPVNELYYISKSKNERI